MSIEATKAAAEKVIQTVETIKAQSEEQANRMEAMDAKVQAIQDAHKNFAEEFGAYRRDQLDNQVSDKAERSHWYLKSADNAKDVELRKSHPRSFVGEREGQALQVFAVKTKDGDLQYGYLDDPDPVDKTQLAVQKAFADRRRRQTILAALAGHKTADQQVLSMQDTPASDREVFLALREAPAAIRKIFSEDPTLHGAFMPISVDPEFERDLAASYGLTSLYRTRNHPGGTVKMPYQPGYLQVFGGSVPTANTGNPFTASSLPQTQSEDITTSRLTAGSYIDRESSEQAIIMVEEEIAGKLLDAYRFAEEAMTLHGKVAGDLDTLAGWDLRGRYAVTANDAKHQLRQWDGMRAYAEADAANRKKDMAGAEDYSDFLDLMAMLKAEQLMQTSGESNLVLHISPEYFFSTMIHLPEFKTWDNVGALASILTGNIGSTSRGLPNQVGILANRLPVCLAFTLTPEFDASGVHSGTPANNVQNICVLSDRSRWEYWTSRNIRTERDISIENDTVVLVTRKSMTMRFKQGAYPAAVVGYGLS